MSFKLISFVLLQVLANIGAQLLLEIYKPLGDVFGDLVGGFVLVKVTVQRFNTHVAAVGQQVGGGGVGAVPAHLHFRFHVAHTFCHEIGLLTLVTVLPQQVIDFIFKNLVLSAAFAETILETAVTDAVDNVVYGGYTHFYACVAFTQQLYGIVFYHAYHSFALVCVFTKGKKRGKL